jgi:antirestriction protein ArdC
MRTRFGCVEISGSVRVTYQDSLDNNAAYIAGWLGKLKNDRQLVVHAAGKAQKSTDYVLVRDK